MEFKYFSFQAWKVMEFNIIGHGKSCKIIVCVICKLLQVSKQGQNKIQASYVRKYPKTRMIFYKFWKWQLNFRPWKTGKSHRKGHGKSWNLKSSKEYEPWRIARCSILRRNIQTSFMVVISFVFTLWIIYEFEKYNIKQKEECFIRYPNTEKWVGKKKRFGWVF